MTPLARANRRETGFSPTSTIRLAPVASKWLSSLMDDKPSLALRASLQDVAFDGPRLPLLPH